MIEMKINEASLADIKSRIAAFSNALQRRVVSEGLRAGAILLADAIRNAPTPVRKEGGGKKYGKKGEIRYPGNLLLSINVVRRKRKMSKGQIMWLTGPLNINKRSGYYGIMVEKGHKPGGWNLTKQVPPHPFAMPAFKRSVPAIIKTVIDKMEDGAIKTAERLRLKATRGQARL